MDRRALTFPVRTLATILALTAAAAPPLATQAQASPPSSARPAAASPAYAKTRLIVLTDIGGDPDDKESLVRLMTYSNQFDIEALIATANGEGVFPQRIHEVLDAYEKVQANLELHEPGFPRAQDLRGRIGVGPAKDGRAVIGAGNDTSGSDLLIKVVDRDDPRPVWVTVWGGPGVLAQALWKVRQTRSKAELDRFVAKLRVYAISDQDDSGPGIRNEFPGLFYIVNPGPNFHQSTWIGISGDNFHGRFGGADYSLVTNEWLDRNVRSKGPLGEAYPNWKFQMEGDTPSFLYLVQNGLGSPEHPDWGSWGGRYELYTPRTDRWFYAPETRPIWTTATDEVLGLDNKWQTSNHATVWRWRSAFQNDFAARMDWTIKPYAQANHPPVPRLDHAEVLKAKPGQTVDLSATASSDPDGDALSYEWFVYEEAGTRPMSNNSTGVKLPVKDFDQPKASVVVKKDRVKAPGYGTIHVILAVTDHGTPRLTRYKRVIIDVKP